MIAVHYAENSPRKDEFQVPSVDSPALPPMGAVSVSVGCAVREWAEGAANVSDRATRYRRHSRCLKMVRPQIDMYDETDVGGVMSRTQADDCFCFRPSSPIPDAASHSDRMDMQLPLATPLRSLRGLIGKQQ